MNQLPKVSIITPFYNAEKYLAAAIDSVINQSYENWELLLIDDGSTDQSYEIAQSYAQDYISVHKQTNQGVSAARNKGLRHMTGELFCFLDADDLMWQDSLSGRVSHFDDPEVAFVGGGQEHKTFDLTDSLLIQLPDYEGDPRKGLISIDDTCFINCGTWLIRNNLEKSYSFPIGWTHSEDLAFFLSISNQGKLVPYKKVVQTYRRHDTSAMANLDKLHVGYKQFYDFAEKNGFLHNQKERAFLRNKISSIMLKSYLRKGRIIDAFQVLTRRKQF